MDFTLNESQLELRARARDMLDANFSGQAMREAEGSDAGFPQELWAHGVRHGWAGMTIAREFGGWGTDLFDACLLLEEVGRAGATLPLVVSSGVSAAILQNLLQGAVRASCLSDIASGKIMVPALIDEQGRNEWDEVRLPLTYMGDGYEVSGTKILVPFASSADMLLVSARTPEGEAAILALDPLAQGIAITPHTAGVGVPMASVTFTNVSVSDDAVLGQGDAALGALHHGLHTGSLLATAEAVGLSETIKTLATQYVTQREAFGQPIGAFQAVAHRCADMHIANETIRLLVHQAAWKQDTGKDAVEEIASTKALANELFERVANDAFCFHGAAGFAEEVDLQLFMRRIRYFCASLGETQETLERAADAAGI